MRSTLPSFFTICAFNYLDHAAVLADSLEAVGCGKLLVFVLESDKFPDTLRVEDIKLSTNMQCIGSSTLGIPFYELFEKKYSLIESNTAIKPWCFKYLFNKSGAKSAIYLDPDLYFYKFPKEVVSLLKRFNAVVTPHLYGLPATKKGPTVESINFSGQMNFGFLGLRFAEETEAFLDWWQDRLYRECIISKPRSIFVDQSWGNWILSFIKSHRLITTPVHNLAYWNVEGHELTKQKGEYYVDNAPLVFFHFSGVKDRKPDKLSKHSPIFIRDSVMFSLVSEYEKKLAAYGTYKDYVPTTIETRLSGQIFQKNEAASQLKFLEKTLDLDEILRFQLEKLTDHDYLNCLKNIDFINQSEAFRRYIVSRPDLQKVIVDEWGTVSDVYRWVISNFEEEPEINAEETITKLHNPNISLSRFLDELNQSGMSTHVTHTINTWLARHDLREHFSRDFWNFTIWLLFQNAKMSLEYWFFFKKNKVEIVNYLNYATSTAGGEQLYDNPIDLMLAKTTPLLALNNPELLLCSKQSANLDSVFAASFEKDDQRERFKAIASKCRNNPNPSINVFGYPSAVSGMGESIRSLVDCLREAKFKVSVIDLGSPNARKDIQLNKTFPGVPILNPDYAIFVVNADNFSQVYDSINPIYLSHQKNIAYWVWETKKLGTFIPYISKKVDEIWTPSNFSKSAIEQNVDVPVRVVPHRIHLSYFDLYKPKDVKSIRNFLFAFDSASSAVRKNSACLIDAWEKSNFREFGATLTLKVNGNVLASTYEHEIFERAISLGVNISFEQVPNENMAAYYSVFDCFVSLHKSEGFGLAIAENMALGNLVITSGAGGAADFCNNENVVLVDTQSAQNIIATEAYRVGEAWWDVSVESAVNSINVALDGTASSSLVKNAHKLVLKQFSQSKLGDVISVLLTAKA